MTRHEILIIFLALSLGLGWFLPAEWVRGQELGARTRETEAMESLSVPVTARSRQAPLDVIVLYNASGKRNLILPGDWPLEVLDEFNQYLLRDQRESTPPYTIQTLTARGHVVGNRVECHLRLIITSSGSQTVRIPLGLKEGVLPFSEAADGTEILPYKYIGSGSFDLVVHPEDGQYVALIHPDAKTSPTAKNGFDFSSFLSDIRSEEEPSGMESAGESVSGEQRHELALSMWFPLTKISEDEFRLSISFAQSVSSQLILTVPMAGAVATVSQGVLIDELDTADTQTTRFNILGLKSNFDLSWRRRKSDPIEERPVLYVEEVSIVARLENKSTVYDAILPVRSPSGGFDRVRVRLPQGSVLDRESTEKYATTGGYSFRELSEEERRAWIKPSNEEGEGLRQTAPIVEIQFSQKKFILVNIRLRAVQQISAEKPGQWRELGGFEVLGAERQYGFLSVGIPAEMRPNWKPIRGIRRVDVTNALIQEGIDARFEFFSQPFSLRSQIVLPQTRINVKPEYQVRVNRGILSLTCSLSFSIIGSKAEKLAVRLNDWHWSGEIGPSSVVDVEGVEQDESGLLSIPLRVPSDGEFTIDLKAHRVISTDHSERCRIVLPLPQPDQTNWTEPAAFVVVPADNVEIIPVDSDSAAASAVPGNSTPSVSATEEPQRTIGLTRRGRRSMPLKIEIPTRQQDPLVYQSDSTEAVFVADVQYHKQEIKADIQTDIRLLEPSNQITELISYDVAYEPVDRLSLHFPINHLDSDRINVSLSGKTLELRDIISSGDEEAPIAGVMKRVSLPEAMIGKFQLVVRYSVPPVPVEPEIKNSFSLTFVRPVDVPVKTHHVNVLVRPGVQVELRDDTSRLWKVVETGSFGADTVHPGSGTRFISNQQPDRISLLVSLADRDVLGTTVVERAWLQTWLTDNLRMDRGTYWVTSDRDHVTLWLPSKVSRSRVIVKRDRIPIPVRITPKGELTIPLTEEQKRRPFLLEVWYQIPETVRRQVRLEMPHFSDDALVRYEYWQLILPQHRHVLGVPSGWTPEYYWGWTGLFWGRIPSIRMEQIGLQGDASDTPLISTESNQYLYSNLHPVPEVTFQVMDRALIVLISSSLALLVGLILIYFPKTRYAGALLGIVVALIAMTAYQPAPVLLMLQASGLGILIALGAAYVYRIFYREEQWILPRQTAWADSSVQSEVYSVIMDEDDEIEKPRS